MFEQSKKQLSITSPSSREECFRSLVSLQSTLYWLKYLLEEVETIDAQSEVIKIAEDQVLSWEDKTNRILAHLTAAEAERTKIFSQVFQHLGEKQPFRWLELTVDNVDPPTAWPFQQVSVQFTLTNHSSSITTSGFATGSVGTDVAQVIMEDKHVQKSAEIVNLAPGQTAHGILLLKRWVNASNFPVGNYVISLYYWSIVPEDAPNASYTVTQRTPDGQTKDVTYGMLAMGIGSLELYPNCQPEGGPDYLSISSFSAFPRIIPLGEANSVMNGQSITLSWSVIGGGFPEEGSHQGSISGVILSGPGIDGYGIPVEASGQRTIYIGGMSVEDVVKPFTLIAFGNCGQEQESLMLEAEFDADMDGIVDTEEHRLLEKFRPYYKYSYDHDSDERYLPIDVSEFIEHCQLVVEELFQINDPYEPPVVELGVIEIANEVLAHNPGAILSATDNQSNLCSYDGLHQMWHCSSNILENGMRTAYHLSAVDRAVWRGKDWDTVKGSNIGLYGHVVPIPDPKRYNLADGEFYKIEYWQFFAYNNAAQIEEAGDHEGDWSTVQLIIDAVTEEIISVFHYAHGDEMRFDMSPCNLRVHLEGDENVIEFRGPNFGKEVDIGYLVSHGFLADRNREGHSNAQNNLVRFYHDPATGEYTHPVVYIEYGTHEFWPSQYWSYWAVPAHNGEGSAGHSYLPPTPQNLGEVEHPLLETPGAPIILQYNGIWGLHSPAVFGQSNPPPPGPPLHKAWQWPWASSIRWLLHDNDFE